jgi:hypothetical protein
VHVRFARRELRSDMHSGLREGPSGRCAALSSRESRGRRLIQSIMVWHFWPDGRAPTNCCPTSYLSLADVTPYHSVPRDVTILVATIGEEVRMPSRVRVATNRTGQAETRCRVARGILR